MGSGRQTEDQVVHMVIAHFLRLNTRYVSLVDGGYAALHEALGPPEFNSRIVNHETDICFVCASNKGQQMAKLARQKPPSAANVITTPTKRASGPGVFSKLSGLLRKPSHQQPFKPPVSIPTQPTVSLHKPSASYRNTAAVFSIDDNDDDDEEESAEISSFKPSTYLPAVQKHGFTSLEHCSPGDLVEIIACQHALEVQAHFKCHLLNQMEQLADEGAILLLERHFIVVKEKRQQLSDTISNIGNRVQQVFSSKQHQNSKGSGEQKYGIVCASIPLTAMIRITSNKRIPEVITFHYSRLDDLVSESMQTFRLFISNAGDAVKAVKMAVFKVNAIETGTPA